MALSKESLNLLEQRKAQLKEIIPEAFTEGKLDVDKLRRVLGEEIETSGERYQFTWAGKGQAIRLRDKRSKGTVIPSKKESVDFDSTNNVFIEGENLEVLKILQKSYQGKVKMIYIDPPYNTGKDFVYKDDFKAPLQNYLKITGQIGENGEKLSTNPETSGRYHSNWLSMMYPRLSLARNLLSEDGVIFISIDDNEVHNLRLIMNEIFGEENFVAQLIWKRKAGGASDSKYIAVDHEYLICYLKDKHNLDSFEIKHSEKDSERFNEKDEVGNYYLKTLEMPERLGLRPNLEYPITAPDGTTIEFKRANKKYTWVVSEKKFQEMKSEGDIVFKKIKKGAWRVYRKLYMGTKTPRSLLTDIALNRDATTEMKSIFTNTEIFSNPKPMDLIKHLLAIAFGEKDDGIILDFFAGSGTTGHAVLEQNAEDSGNRRFILVQLPEQTPVDSEARKAGYKTLADICKERIRRVIKKVKEEQKQEKLGEKKQLDLGFKVFKLSKSNCFVWDEEETKDSSSLAKHIEQSAKGASEADSEELLFEIMLREGFQLDSKIENLKISKNEFYKVSDAANRLFACFDKKIDAESVKQLQLEKDDKIVVLDSALTDTQKVNLARKIRIETV